LRLDRHRLQGLDAGDAFDRKAWFSAPRFELLSRRRRNSGVAPAEIAT